MHSDEDAQANIPVQKCPVAMRCIELCLQATDQVELLAVPAVHFVVKMSNSIAAQTI